MDLHKARMSNTQNNITINNNALENVSRPHHQYSQTKSDIRVRKDSIIMGSFPKTEFHSEI